MIEPLISVLSSMATRPLLTELAATWDGPVSLEAVGGVEAARRIRAGATFHVVILAEGPMRALAREGFVAEASLAPIAISSVAVAVREGEPLPDLSSPAALERAVSAAGRIGFSTGPSGDHLLGLLDRWGVRAALGDRLVQAPAGIPVGRLLAEEAVDMAFQQNSELIGLPGIVVAGALPGDAACDTAFVAGLTRRASDAAAAGRFIALLTAADTEQAKRRHGMRPA